MTEFLILMSLFLGLLLAGVPIAFCLGFSAIALLTLAYGFGLEAVGILVVDGVDKWTWLALPLFIMAGQAMNQSGVTKRLLNLSHGIVGHISGGLGHVTVICSTLVGGMTASMLADAAAEGIILLPTMKKQGFPAGYSAAIISVSSLIAVLIPPSITLIIVGQLLEISILRLWLGGIIPALLVAFLLFVVGYSISKYKGYPKSSKRASFRELGELTSKSGPALIIPIIILGGMRLGLFTPTEAGAVAVTYILFLGLFVHKELKLRQIFGIALESAHFAAGILFIIAMGILFVAAVSLTNVDAGLAEFLKRITTQPLVFLLLVTIFTLIMGCFINLMAMIMIFSPLAGAIAAVYGVDPVHFGVVFTFAALVGQFTPPNGLCMFMLCDMAGCSIGEYTRQGWPFIAGVIISLLLCVFFPQLILWLPDLIM